MIRLPALISVFFLASCGQVSDEPVQSIVAKVGNGSISYDELEYQASRLAGKGAVNVLNNSEQRRQLVDSMALTLLFAQKQQEMMSEEELAKIELATQAYRRELLAKEYIERNLPRKVPSQKDVESYYLSHLDQFGGGDKYRLKVISLSDQCAVNPTWLDSPREQSVITDVEKLDCAKKVSSALYSSKQLKGAYPSLPDDLIVGRDYWVRAGGIQEVLHIESKREGSPKPLAEVSSDIRKSLAPSFLREALQEKRLKFSKEIEYLD